MAEEPEPAPAGGEPAAGEAGSPEEDLPVPVGGPPTP